MHNTATFSGHRFRAKRILRPSALFIICICALLWLVHIYKVYAPVLYGNGSMRTATLNALADDAFFYLKIAQNIVLQSFSSFDGMTETNGYHPLWMIVLVLCGYVINVHSTLYLIMALFVLPIVFSFAGLYFLHRFLCTRGEEYRKTAVFMLPCFVYFFRPFAAMGMETALLQFSFPLLLFSLSKFIMQPTRRWATGFFLSGTLLALSRLDTILLTGPLYCLVFLYMSREKRFSPVQFLLLCALGTLPLFVYLGYNSMEFGSIMPVSGAVKGLRNAPIIISFYSLSTVGEHFLRSKKFLLQALIAVIALVPAIGSMRRKPDSMNAVFIWLLVFPLFFFVTTAMRSDWPIWSWYFYPLPLAATIGVLILFMHRVKALSYTVTTGAILTILLCVTIVEVIKDHRARYQDLILNSGHYLTYRIGEFMKSDTAAVYAMGDRAGSVGFLLPNPLIHLEGLVGDRRMVENIKNSRNLNEVLAEYTVDYYIAINPVRSDSGWLVEEPHVPGRYAPKMRGRMQSDPVYTLDCQKMAVRIFRIIPAEF